MDLGIKDRVAIVTGCANPQGIGRAIAAALAMEGCDVACLDKDPEGVNSAAAQIRDLGRRSIAVTVDQSDYEQVKKAVNSVEQEFGRIDILVNNAALLGNVSLIKNMSVANWDKEMSVNLSGPFYFVKEVFPKMMIRGWGRILNISSIAGIGGSYGQVGYSSTKAGLIGLTRTMALEGAKFGVTSNILILGLINSAALRAHIREDMLESIVKDNALRRLGTVQEVGDIAAFLLSDRAGFVTGAEIIMDGGHTLLV
jgi:3-oxoacyl-[acyl-carrier protein] reductase